MEDTTKYHNLAKEAGNKLRAYILSVASGGTGVFFLALTKTDISKYSCLEKYLLLIALSGFIITVVLSLYELRIDAQRFFALAKELEKVELQRTWCKYEVFKKKRLFIINFSYFTLGTAIVSLFIYLGLKILNT